MNEKLKEQTNESIIFENSIALEKAQMALDELLNEYDRNFVPTIQKALNFSSAVGKEVHNCSDEEKFSWKFMYDYKRIMWLIRIASDYCYSALENCNKVC